MFGQRITIAKHRGDEAEKPFWISFSDLMSALMVLFLVVMTVALLSVTQELRNVEQKAKERQKEIAEIMQRLAKEAERFPAVNVSEERLTIDFGEVGRFLTNKDALSSEAAGLLRGFVPAVLKEAKSDLGKKWFKRVVVEGFTDTDGTYLHNLDLSLRRAERVVCILLTAGSEGSTTLTETEMADVRRFFMVGGFSFNSAKLTKDESRRVELRLDFRAIGEEDDSLPAGMADLSSIDVGKCRLEDAG
jgi:outer membrane protein OmpA-like peptidoglycan-associated protein